MGSRGTAWSAPWRRAPLLLLRTPGVVLALVLATAILGIAAASGPLFLASTGSATLTRGVEADCIEQSSPSVSNPAVAETALGFGDFYRQQTGAEIENGDHIVTGAMQEIALPTPYRVLIHDAELRPGTDPVNTSVTLFSRADALEHVEIVAGTDGPGLWVSDRFATGRGLQPGDIVEFAAGSAPVAGVYRDLSGDSFLTELPAYWCSWSDLILPTLERRPPPFVLVDPQTLYSLVPPLQAPDAEPPEIRAWWYSPVGADRLSLASARELTDRVAQLPAALHRVALDSGRSGSGYTSDGGLTELVTAAEGTREGLRGPVIPVAIAATVVALVLVGAAGGLWVEQRSREVALLRSRGVSTRLIGLKALLEMLPSVCVGAAVGWAAALGLLRVVGPSPLLDPGSLRTAAWTVGVAAVAGLAALSVLAAVGSARRVDPSPRGRFRLVLVPWELTVVAAAALVYRQVDEQGGITSFGQTVTLSPLLIAFPLLALLGGLLLTARLLALLLPWLRRHSDGWRPAGWLSIRALTGATGVVIAVFTLTAVPIGALVYSAGLSASLETSVAAKAGTYNGADQAFDLRAQRGVEPDPDIDGVGTVVHVVGRAVIGGELGQLLGIAPAEFAEYADWRDEAVGGSPEEILGALAAGETGGPLPAILVGRHDGPVTEVQLFATDVSVQVVAQVDNFPGLRAPLQPMLVVDQSLLGDADRYADRQVEVWTDDEHADALIARLAGAGVQVERDRGPVSFTSATDLLPVTWTFGYLQTIAVLTGLIAVTALLLYVAARQRQRFASFHLSRRMGLRTAKHLRTLAAEVGLILGVAWLTGGLLGTLCVRLAYGLVDLNPTFPPPPLFVLPTGLLGWSALAVLVACLVTAAVGHLAARATSAGAVLRLS